MSVCVCSQTQGQVIARAWFATRPRGETRRQPGSSRIHIPADARNRWVTSKVTYQGKQRWRFALPQRQTAFRQTPPTVTTTRATVEAVNPKAGGVGSPLPSSLCAFTSPFFFYSNWVAFRSSDCAQTHLPHSECVSELLSLCQCVCLCVRARVRARCERLRVSGSFPGGVCYIHSQILLPHWWSCDCMWRLLWLAGGGAGGAAREGEQRRGGLKHWVEVEGEECFSAVKLN